MAGAATHRVPSARFPDLLQGLYGTVSVDALLAAFSEPAGEGPVNARREPIDRLFVGDRVESILRALDNETGEHAEWARATAANIRTKSPLSLKLALAQVRRGKAWDFATCMQTEFRIVSRVIRGHDFYEGVRAVIVDKDNKPNWRPATLDEVTAAEVERHFSPLEGGDALVLP
jgi:enoyl-CoA hydratase